MGRRWSLFLLLLAGTVGPLGASAPARPNLVFILADDLGYGEVSYHGQTRYTTPNLDRLAREGMVFTDAYAGSTICAPSRNCLLTGQHTGHATIRNNFAGGGNDGGRVALKPTDTTLAERLHAAGYTTGMIGKWGLGEDDTPSAPWRRGWDFFHGFVNQTHAHNQFPEFLYRNAGMEPLVENYGHKERVYAHDLFTQEALAFLDRQRDATQPFFLYLAYTLPHADVKAPTEAVEEAKRKFPGLAAPGVPEVAAAFAAMVMRLDADVGQLVTHLRDLGLEDNTLVIFTSDNGPHEEDGKDPAWFRSSGQLRGIKRDVYEGGIREPFFARWPGRIAPGTTSALPIAFWDFPATALEIAGLPRPADLPAEGISYAPTLLGRGAAQAQHDYLYWEISIKGQARQAVRTGQWKGVRYGLESKLQLYDLTADPGETHDLAAAQPERVAQLTQLIATAHVDSPDFPLTPGGTGKTKNKKKTQP